ncbi:MAG: hypothetical protein ABGY95_08665, partial [Rubritalea sp.]|uniref:hypothetical protein n=1 Tax=Rubritalea sp. TaxID=2109375 RepID=UPI00324272FD
DLLELLAMEGHLAHGYSRDVLHDTNVKVTNVLAEGALTINTEVVWLASSKNCFSSTGFFQLRLPVAQYPQISCDSEKLQRESVPELNGWSVSVQFDSVIYQPGLALNKPRHSPTIGIYRYSEDGQATAIFTQTVHDETDRNLFLSIAPVSFGPKDLSDLPCLLYSKNGWEGSAVKYVRSTSPHYEN